MSTTVYLADLRYNYSGVLANDCMPLGVAFMKAVMDRDLSEAKSRLFAYPDALLEAIQTAPPDVLMLSNYVWNKALSLHFAKLAKRIRPETLVVMGGPNLSIEPNRQRAFFERHPQLDAYILGEGDFLATEVVRLFLEAGQSIRRLGEREIPSCLYRRPDGTTAQTPAWPRQREVDEIPSPWLTGILDEFFDGKLAPMIETNRGCPFTGTFCVQGTGWYTKVHYFDLERVKEELSYIAKRIHERSPAMGMLRIADPNYGMYERDVEISSHIGLMQKHYQWPTFIDATTGKNRPERIIESVEKVSGALVLYQAVQSLDETVLRNIKRSTIKLEAYQALQVHMRGRGLRSNSDLILGLPGETLQTARAAIHKLIDAGVDQVHNFQLMMLPGSELEKEESRDTFSFDTRYRVLPKNFGLYGGEQVLDVEEIVVATDSLPFQHYIEARKYHLCSSIFWNDSWFRIPVDFLASLGLKRSEIWDCLLPALEAARGPARKLLDDFVRETIGELFPTAEACVEFYRREENFEKLSRGEIGDNLMYKYRALASFHLWPEVCEVAMGAFGALVASRNLSSAIPGFDEFWRSLHRFVQAEHAHGSTPEEILSPASALLDFDVPRWLSAGSPRDPSPYRLDPPQRFDFRLTPEGARELRRALEVWGWNLKGLSKLVTRIQMAWQVREAAQIQEERTVA